MNIDLEQCSPNQVYHSLIQTLIPRPIAWVLSENANASFNLAPFSYFNAISSNPPLLMISVGRKADGSMKDTRINIEARKHFVVHIANASQRQLVNDSSANLPNEASELEQLDIATTDFEYSTLPRIEDAPIAYACELFDLQEIGNTPMSMIIGLIKGVYIDDRIVEIDDRGRSIIDAAKVDPLARLGGINFATLGEIFPLTRPE